MLSPDDGSDVVGEPRLFNLLPPLDQQTYNTIKKDVKTEGAGIRTLAFDEMLTRIKNFCSQNDELNQVRCYVCGICWYPGGLAINFHQFKILVPLLKSTIQSLLQRLGYNSTRSTEKQLNQLTELVPRLINDPHEQRSWHFYQYIAMTPKNPQEEEVFQEVPKSPQPFVAVPPIEAEKPFEPKGTEQEIYSFFDDPFLLPPVFLVEDASRSEDSPIAF